MLIDGNDDRGIDVALLTKTDYPIARIRSHVDDRDDRGLIFSRDCPEYTIDTSSDERIVLLVNHLKSKGYGSQAASNARRERQAHTIAEIYARLLADGEQNVVVLGDFNDFPDSPPLAPLLAQTDLRDISTHTNFDDGGRPGTYANGTVREKIDYILLSPALWPRVADGGIYRQRRLGRQKRHPLGALPNHPLPGPSRQRPLGDLRRHRRLEHPGPRGLQSRLGSSERTLAQARVLSPTTEVVSIRDCPGL
jgi:hypothetical protein